MTAEPQERRARRRRTRRPTGPPRPAATRRSPVPAGRSNGRTVAAVIAVVIVIAVVQLLLPASVTIGPLWLIPALELLGIPLGIAVWVWPRQDWAWLSDRVMHRSMTVYLGFLVLASALNAVLLLVSLLTGSDDSGALLLLAGFGVLLINVLTFGLTYWWLDGGGPKARATGAVDGVGLPVSSAGGGTDLDARDRRLPLHGVHQHHRLQPYRHDAADPTGQAAVRHAVDDLAGDDPGDAEPGRQSHPRLTAPRRPRVERLRDASADVRRGAQTPVCPNDPNRMFAMACAGTSALPPMTWSS